MSISLLSNDMRANFRHLYADVLWFGLLAGSTAAFLAIFAARQGASSFQVSLLTAGPAVVNLLFSLPAGRWLEGRSLVRESFRSSVLQRLGYLFMVPVPWLFTPFVGVWIMILITLLMAIPATLLAVSFNAMFLEATPAHVRAEVVGKRNALMAVSMTVTSLVCGQLLDRVLFPWNYQIVFLIGASGALLSSYHLGKIRSTRTGMDPGRDPDKTAARTWGRWLKGDSLLGIVWARPRSLLKGNSLRFDLIKGPFGSFLFAYLFFYTGQYVGIPLFPLYQVRILSLSNSAIGVGSVLFYIVMSLVSLQLRRMNTRFSHRQILVVGIFIYWLYPLLIGLAGGVTLFWIASLIAGGAWALVSSGLINRLMEVAKEEERSQIMALHNLTMNLGILAGSLFGPYLSETFGLRDSVMLVAGIRLLSGLIMLRLG